MKKAITRGLAAAHVLLATQAFAVAAEGDGKWIAKGSNLVDDIRDGLVTIGGPLIGVGIVAIGALAALAGHLEWRRMGYVVLGGLLIAAGPAMVTTLFDFGTPVRFTSP